MIGRSPQAVAHFGSPALAQAAAPPGAARTCAPAITAAVQHAIMIGFAKSCGTALFVVATIVKLEKFAGETQCPT
jgi:hypothetical protein